MSFENEKEKKELADAINKFNNTLEQANYEFDMQKQISPRTRKELDDSVVEFLSTISKIRTIPNNVLYDLFLQMINELFLYNKKTGYDLNSVNLLNKSVEEIIKNYLGM